MASKTTHFPPLLLTALLLASLASSSEITPTLITPSSTVISGNSTLLSPNGTFAVGFFTTNGGAGWYLGVWYASIPIRTYVWVANRAAPARSPASWALTPDGRLAVLDSSGSHVWTTDNAAPAMEAKLLDTGNLVLLSPQGLPVWQSFDHPADTWLPEMAVTRRQAITSWRSVSDPSVGLYSLRLRPESYGEFELVFNGSVRYWSTGSWTGTRFAGVPEMMVANIYTFWFASPFTPDASFFYSVAAPPDFGLRPLLARFVVDHSGQLMQYAWSPQAASWETFWSRPESACKVFGRCGSLGLCTDSLLHPCDCPAGLRPADPVAWSSGDFTSGCTRGNDELCRDDDDFEALGAVELDGAVEVSSFGVSRGSCEEYCRKNCSCFGLNYNAESKSCRNLYGSAYNLRNSSESPVLYIRVSAASNNLNEKRWRVIAVAGGISGFFVVLGLVCSILVVLKKRKAREGRSRGEDGGEFPVTNLTVFSYKELSAATRGFSEKLGHGGFGAVFRGSLPGSTQIAVKRLERGSSSGEREFRAEVRTIGGVHHVNLVRLRGFCCEGPHRLLVYDYVPNGPLSSYLRRHRSRSRSQFSSVPLLSWEARFRIAVGTARGIAYLHEECRDCILHCDIKPENILLDRDYTPKVADFGLARLMDRELSRVLITMRGTWGYVAPEWITGVAITPKADVYSYGMTLLELLGGRRNVEPPPTDAGEQAAGEEEKKPWFFPAWAARRIVEGGVGEVVDEGLGGRYETGEAERAGRVAVWCIQDEEAARPAMGDVVKMLEGAVEVGVPPLPQLLQALVSTGDSFPRAGLASRASSSNGSGDKVSTESDRIKETGPG